MRNIEFVPRAFEEYRHWIEKDRKTAKDWRFNKRYFKGSVYWNWGARAN